MMEYFYLYMLGNNFSLTFGFTGIIIWMVVLIIAFIKSEYNEIYVNKFLVTLASLFTLLGIIIPSTNSLAYMGAYYVGKNITHSETGQKLLKVINEKLDYEIEHITKNK